jgi:type II secretory ATPase GspE/PulE/Tfp pilus assembly ATPase PilB-like protein
LSDIYTANNPTGMSGKAAAMRFSKKRLGDILIDQGLVTKEELNAVLLIQQAEGTRLGEILIRQGLLTEKDLTEVLSNQLNLPVTSLNKQDVQPGALSMVPEELARKYIVFPLAVVENVLVLAMAYPDEVRAIRDLGTRTGKQVQIVLATKTDINNAIDLFYRSSKAIENSVGQIAAKISNGEESSTKLTSQTPVAQSLDLILKQAVRDRASDVHIEPQENRLRIRYRIDGVLHDMYSLPMSAHGPLISRIKILAEMNIAEQRRSQDGQFSFKNDNAQIDIRTATMSTAYGERVTMRILDKAVSPLSLEDLGFLPEQLAKFKKILNSPFGTVLVGGPTGSGKTTTLYACINQFDRDAQNIITIEDPVEYKFGNISQTSINNKAGITFATGLRTILRHDPDIVLVGEVRDRDTAGIVTQASLTGRLVLASIHANDAVSILFRLVDLGIEPYLISPTLVAAIAQRMVRRICTQCKQPKVPDQDEEALYTKVMGEPPKQLFYGTGCNMCANTGYRGRVPLVEILVMSESLRRLVLTGASADLIKQEALKEGMMTMQRDGMLKAKMGMTSISEVLRSTHTMS